MKNNRANRHNDRGFTLSEVLLTVAILVVLFALAAVPVSKMRRELRQTELDSKAEILFQTAQNRISLVRGAVELSVARHFVYLLINPRFC